MAPPPPVCITIDDRESHLQQALRDAVQLYGKAAQFDVHVDRLVLGDVTLMGGGSNLHMVVERKRHDDLMASLIDGRLQEQQQRLLEWQTEHGTQQLFSYGI